MKSIHEVIRSLRAEFLNDIEDFKIPKTVGAMQKALARRKLKLARAKRTKLKLKLMAQIQKLGDFIRFYSQPKVQADLRYFNYPNLKEKRDPGCDYL